MVEVFFIHDSEVHVLGEFLCKCLGLLLERGDQVCCNDDLGAQFNQIRNSLEKRISAAVFA